MVLFSFYFNISIYNSKVKVIKSINSIKKGTLLTEETIINSFKEVYVDEDDNIDNQIFTYNELKKNTGKYLAQDIKKYENVYSTDFIN